MTSLLVACGLLLSLMFFVAVRGIAALQFDYAYLAKNMQLQKRLAHMESSLSLYDNDPAALEYTGTLYMDFAVNQNFMVRITFWRKALALFRKALRIRPVSPYTWGNLALVKLYLWEYDAELTQAFDNISAYGPWTQDIHLLLVKNGLKVWNLLDTPTQNSLDALRIRLYRMEVQ
ncbi:hypothetical protein TI03_00290 [Achromatium sp. WMS1]|nr:hypothetical protein TI03_00290 [Achromatium sp. WMS1]